MSNLKVGDLCSLSDSKTILQVLTTEDHSNFLKLKVIRDKDLLPWVEGAIVEVHYGDIIRLDPRKIKEYLEVDDYLFYRNIDNTYAIFKFKEYGGNGSYLRCEFVFTNSRINNHLLKKENMYDYIVGFLHFITKERVEELMYIDPEISPTSLKIPDKLSDSIETFLDTAKENVGEVFKKGNLIIQKDLSETLVLLVTSDYIITDYKTLVRGTVIMSTKKDCNLGSHITVSYDDFQLLHKTIKLE